MYTLPLTQLHDLSAVTHVCVPLVRVYALIVILSLYQVWVNMLLVVLMFAKCLLCAFAFYLNNFIVTT